MSGRLPPRWQRGRPASRLKPFGLRPSITSVWNCNIRAVGERLNPTHYAVLVEVDYSCTRSERMALVIAATLWTKSPA